MGTYLRFEFATFTASEAERISGVSGQDQRNLRRLKYMPPIAITGSRARLGLEELACLVVIGILSRIPPAQTAKVALKCAPMVVANALTLNGAVEGADKRALDRLLKKFAPDGLRRYAIGIAPDFTDLKFIKDDREAMAKVFYAKSEVRALSATLFVHDLLFYATMMLDKAKQPLVTVSVEEEAA